MPVKPIAPSEVIKQKEKSLPDEVILVFNELLAQNFSDGRAVVQQDAVVKLLEEKGLKRGEIFRNHWLDVEEIYKKAGWFVEYDKPAYNEDYPATFTFKHQGI